MRAVGPAGVALIRRFEGLRLHAYQDAVGLWTIGYGHLLAERNHVQLPSSSSLQIDEGQAEELLAADSRLCARAVLRLISVPLSDGQFDALGSYVFNLGGGALQRSTLRAVVNREEHESVPAEFTKWVWAGGRRLPGLVARRAAEANLYEASEMTR